MKKFAALVSLLLIQLITFARTEGNTPGGTISVFPNPVKDKLSITLTDFANGQNIRFAIYNVVGKMVKEEVIVGTSTSVDVSAFSTGIYFYKIHSNGKELSSGKLVKTE
ncbi:MAG: T9SS type A sorting domain-containing protein [Bacteroidota bacterium]